MIIGISGKKQHGKDTTAKVLDWIFLDKTSWVPSLKEYVDGTNQDGDIPVITRWEYIKFADKLKDIICMLTGCTRTQLEDDTFKNSFMPIEWNKKVKGSYCSNGGRFSQDDAFYKERNPRYYCIDYDVEDKLEIERGRKDAMLFFTDRRDTFDNSDYRDRKYCVQERRTYRDALQVVGTELFRNGFCDNTWVNSTMSDYKCLTCGPEEPGVTHVDFDTCEYPDWFITDVRFPNEADIIREKGGIMIRVNRIGADCSDLHPSETALDNYPLFDYVIDNDGDLINLYHSLQDMVQKLNLKNGKSR